MGVAVKKEWVEDAKAHGWHDEPMKSKPSLLSDVLGAMRIAIGPTMTVAASRKVARGGK